MGFFDKFKKKETKIENEPEHFLYSEEALDRYEAFISEQFGNRHGNVHVMAQDFQQMGRCWITQPVMD